MKKATITIDGTRWTFTRDDQGEWDTTTDRDADQAFAVFTAGERRAGTERAEAILATLNSGLASTHNLTILNRGLLSELKAGAPGRGRRGVDDRHINDKAVAYACAHISNPILHRRLANSYIRDMPETFWWNLASSPTEEARVVAASRADTDYIDAIQQHLLLDPSSKVREAIAKHTDNPTTLAALADNTDLNVLLAVAVRATDPNTIRAAVRNASDPVVLRGAVKNPELPGDLIADLCESSPTASDTTPCRAFDAAIAAAQHPNCPDTTLTALSARDRHYKIRSAVATNPSTPDRILMALTKDPARSVQYTLLRRPLPRPAFDLLSSRHPKEAASSTHAPVDWLHEQASFGSVPAALNLLYKHRLPTPQRDLLLANPDTYYAATISDLERLRDTRTHAPMLERAASRDRESAELLATSTIGSVRAAAASIGTLPPETVHALATDPDVNVREATARHHSSVARLATTDPDPRVRTQAARHACKVPEIIEPLAGDTDGDVRVAVLQAIPLRSSAPLHLFNDDDDLRVQCELAERREAV